jgi:hypothetical protein
MNVRLKHTMPFTAGVYYGDEMRMNHYTLTLHMITNSHDAVNHNVAFERIKYFVYNKLDSVIFINATHQDKCKQYVNAGIKVSTLPGDPVDQLIGLMLYYKLNAIMEDRIIIEETEISSMLGENMIYLHSENETTDIEFFPDWWTSPEPDHSDYLSLEPDKIVSMHANTAWRELDLTWTDAQVANVTGNIVVFRDFKPADETK